MYTCQLDLLCLASPIRGKVAFAPRKTRVSTRIVILESLPGNETRASRAIFGNTA